MTSNARAHISLRDGIIEFEGEASFVTAQLEAYAPLVLKAFSAPPTTIPKGTDTAGQKDEAKKNGLPSIDEFENLYAVVEGKVQILKDPPGSGKAQKTVSIAILTAYANLLIGNETTSYDSIRELCNSHACLDSSNFSSALKSEKEIFIIIGSGKASSLKLSVPGRKRAEELARRLNNE